MNFKALNPKSSLNHPFLILYQPLVDMKIYKKIYKCKPGGGWMDGFLIEVGPIYEQLTVIVPLGCVGPLRKGIKKAGWKKSNPPGLGSCQLIAGYAIVIIVEVIVIPQAAVIAFIVAFLGIEYIDDPKRTLKVITIYVVRTFTVASARTRIRR